MTIDAVIAGLQAFGRCAAGWLVSFARLIGRLAAQNSQDL
jgi:hypothetical protein